MSVTSGSRFIHAEWALLPDGWRQANLFEVDSSGCILSVGSSLNKASDAQLDVVIPGMINVHSHAFQRRLVGRTQRFSKPNDDFWSWRTQMYAEVDGLTPQDQRVGALELYREMVANGYTTVCEFQYAHGAVSRDNAEIPALMADSLIGASKEAGIRQLLLPVLYQQAGIGEQPPTKDQRSFVLDTRVYLGLMDHLFETYGSEASVSIGYAPHSLRAVGYDALSDLIDHRQDNSPDSPLHIHVSEQVREVNECILGTGKRPIEWLYQNFSPNSSWVFIHSTHASRDELNMIIKSGATVGLCPSTEGDLGDGAFPLAEFIQSKGTFGIGTDSNVIVSPVDELRFIDYQARIRARKRNAFAFDGLIGSGTRLYQKALEGGRKASGQPVGRLESGSFFDLVELTTDHPLTADRSPDEVLNAYVYSGGKDVIKSVWMGGKPVG
ncbi:formimidoylglutamate deiminase [bacterium]|nr:formimidoylglutamate deiminase [bacterium]